MDKPSTSSRQNRVLEGDYAPSRNFFDSDKMLRDWIGASLSADAQAYMADHWSELGKMAAGPMNAWSLTADKQGPWLERRNWLGEDIFEIRFHPDYWRLMEVAVGSQMFRAKWHPALRERFSAERNGLCFSAGYLYAMAESGQYCPLCMTDGVALILDRHAAAEDRERLLPHIATDNPEDFYTGAMFLTEKAGGSDVGANLCRAEHEQGPWYRLYGEKWFCSNANAQIILVLARTEEDRPGTGGLGIFLLEPELPDGSRNEWEVLRLKDKLGVRSMASAEINLNGARAKLIGQATEGFRIMTDMINLSRLYNSVAALAVGRRALVEAFQFLAHRVSFGKRAIEHALVRDKLEELGALNAANFVLSFRAVQAMDAAEGGDEREGRILRLLTPMMKKFTAETATYIVRESMELMGGIGYIEDHVMPKLMRDVLVLPIWEGAGNIMSLDAMRAAHKSGGVEEFLEEIGTAAEKRPYLGKELASLKEELESWTRFQDRDAIEFCGKRLFERLVAVFVASLLAGYEGRGWLWPELAGNWWESKLKGEERALPLNREEAEALIAWKIKD